MAIGGGVSVVAVRHMHSTVERETDQLKNADANSNIVVSADGCARAPRRRRSSQPRGRAAATMVPLEAARAWPRPGLVSQELWGAGAPL
eukprot:COSAG01_NODE_400_length_17542_cov_19.747005_6_plen_89_part_00